MTRIASTVLDGLRRIAVAKALTDKQVDTARTHLKPGEYDVDLTVRVHGTIKVGSPFSQVFDSAVPWEALAKLLFVRMNRATQLSVLDEVITAWEQRRLADVLEEYEQTVDETEWVLLQGLKDRAERPVRGKITRNLQCDFSPKGERISVAS